MRDQVKRYAAKLERERVARGGGAWLLARDDELVGNRSGPWTELLTELLRQLPVTAVALAEPPLPFGDFLVARTPASVPRLVPKDSESKTFLHDIPLLRRGLPPAELAAALASLLQSRKGVLVEGVGIVAAGALTVQQAYINVSSVAHAVQLAYLLQLLEEGYRLPGEAPALAAYRASLERTPPPLPFLERPLQERGTILAQMAVVGRALVELGLVDSFFGNISVLHDGVLYISQTGAALDELPGCIDPVPLDGSTTCGITASSELAVHRRIYAAGDYRTLLHGHPKFAALMSMVCERESGCQVGDCGRDCPEVRLLAGVVPIVAGEIGAGGVAERVPPVVAQYGAALVYGHGPFCAGRSGFVAPFNDMLRIERLCRDRYFATLAERWGTGEGLPAAGG